MNSLIQGIGIPLPSLRLDDSHAFARKHIISLLQKCKTAEEICPIHATVVKHGHEDDPFILFELLRMCAKCNSIGYASKVFQRISNPNVYLYTAFIDVLVSSGLYLDCIRIYIQMIEEFIEPDNYVITSVLRACGFQLNLRKGREIHGQALKLGLCSNRSVKLKLIELYGKCGELGDAQRLFDEMPKKDVVALTVMISCFFDHGMVDKAIVMFNFLKTKDAVCWTAMIDGLVRNGEANKALKLFRQMQREGVRPNQVTIVCILSACAQLGTLELGKWIHSYVNKYDIEINHLVGSALINMYSRCGNIDEAEKIFCSLQQRDVTTYNSLIVGFSLNGKSVEAVQIFQRMVSGGIKPTNITFTAVLNACSQGGLVDLGFEIFETMSIEYGIEPQIEHYGCLVDLLGRAGRVEEAYKFITNMKLPPDNVIWGSLLGACKNHKKFELGEKVAQILFESGEADSGTYILLSNMYSSWGKFEQAAELRKKLKELGVEKEPGCSSIEVANEIHEFLLGDIRHPQREEIYKTLKELTRILCLRGYCPDTESISPDIGDQEKRWALSIHSERLAICYGLISTKPQTTIRVVKNLRVCNDCHTFVKFVSEITGREIVLRDRNRFHHLRNGVCSCADFW
ncbi:hypothetical protein M9H77_01101 [Catharanthus roseus]|uniref:Uncharacterized protein n=1 Tax=Catharanthus roseus TaxID=4058 RepID=A0ACC0C4W2_CATRO|nr:hypothetical protein M9H77_01101 [Catharanthus roseus]